MPDYGYEVLDLSALEIRLLTLLPGNPLDPFFVKLETVLLDLSNPPQYEALSYEWGPREELGHVEVVELETTAQICIGSDLSLVQFPGRIDITANLASALRHLRYKDKGWSLWIDALCINQKDPQERANQVSFMADIFSAASGIVVWLGVKADDSDHAMNLLQFMTSQVITAWPRWTLEPGHTGTVNPVWGTVEEKAPWSNRDLNSLSALFSRSYFQRLWIRQEAFLCSDDSLVLCGNYSIPWHDFKTGIFVTWSKTACVAQAGSLYPYHSQELQLVAPARRVLEICAPFRNHPLHVYLEDANGSKCTDDRDRVYALLTFNRCLRPRFEIDYSKTLYQVYEDIVIAELRGGRMNILAACDMSMHTSGFPSFVRDWRVKSTYLSYLDRSLCRASCSWNGEVICYEPGKVTLAGRQVGKVKQVWSAIYKDQRFTFDGIRSWLDLTLTKTLTDSFGRDAIIDALARVIYAGGSRDSFEPVRDARYPSIHKLRTILEANLTALNDQSLSFCVQDTHYDVATWCYCRCIFLTDGGSLGLGPGMMQPGDEVAVILGNTNPSILRPRPESKERQFLLVGSCYLDGYVNGEAFFGALPPNLEPCVRRGVRKESTRWCYRDKASGIIYDEFRQDPRVNDLIARNLDDEERATWKEGVHWAFDSTLLKKMGIALQTFTLV